MSNTEKTETKFVDATPELEQLFNDVLENEDDFFALQGAKFKLLFYTKAKKKAGKIVLAYVQKANDLIKYLADEIDFIIYFDQNVGDELEEEDRRRIIMHELLHCVYSPSKKNAYSLRDHTIQGFHEEVERESLEGGDHRGHDRVSEVADAIYDKEDDEEE